jgi:hypothetical protein
MRSIISTSIANVIRFSVEATVMLRNDESASLTWRLKSCCRSLLSKRLLGRLLRLDLLGTLRVGNCGTNPAYSANAGFALAERLVLVPAATACRFNLKNGRGIDAIDHQRLTQIRQRRYS